MNQQNEYGLNDNGHCGNCTCHECGGSDRQEAGHGTYCQCKECV